MNDDDIIRQHIDGRSVRAIAKAQRTTVAEINEAIDRWVDQAIRRASTVSSLSWRC
jgi:hypothetical protein